MEREIFSPDEEEAAKNKERARLRAEFQEGVRQREEEKRRKQLASQGPFTEELAEQALSARKERLRKDAERRREFEVKETQHEKISAETPPYEEVAVKQDQSQKIDEGKREAIERRGHRHGKKPAKPGREAVRKEMRKEAA